MKNSVQKSSKKKKNKKNSQVVKVGQVALIDRFNTRLHTRCLIVPDRLVTFLKYVPTPFMNNVGFLFSSRTFNANSVYDVDNALASTAVAGFAELMTLYQNFRVLKVRVRGSVCNQDTYSTMISVVCLNSIPAINTFVAADVMTKHCRNFECGGQAGMNRINLDVSFDLADVFGDRREYLSEAGFAGNVGANPAQRIGLVIASNANHNQANGVEWTLEMLFEVEFFNCPLFTI